jgi:hypothetical protein
MLVNDKLKNLEIPVDEFEYVFHSFQVFSNNSAKSVLIFFRDKEEQRIALPLNIYTSEHQEIFTFDVYSMEWRDSKVFADGQAAVEFFKQEDMLEVMKLVAPRSRLLEYLMNK